MAEGPIVRKLALMRISTKDFGSRSQVILIAKQFRYPIVDISDNNELKAVVVQAVGNEKSIKAFRELMDSFGILEEICTESIRLERGSDLVKSQLQEAAD